MAKQSSPAIADMKPSMYLEDGDTIDGLKIGDKKSEMAKKLQSTGKGVST